jgi:hypothetical protein
MRIHSFAGIGLGIDTVDQLVTKIKKNKKAMGRWMRTKVMIIDESETVTPLEPFVQLIYSILKFLWLMANCLINWPKSLVH